MLVCLALFKFRAKAWITTAHSFSCTQTRVELQNSHKSLNQNAIAKRLQDVGQTNEIKAQTLPLHRSFNKCLLESCRCNKIESFDIIHYHLSQFHLNYHVSEKICSQSTTSLPQLIRAINIKCIFDAKENLPSSWNTNRNSAQLNLAHRNKRSETENFLI